MDKICVFVARRALKSFVIHGKQLNRVAYFSNEPPKPTLPLSKNPKHKTSPRITLMSEDKMEITTLDQAKKLAERRQLKLVNIVDFDTKTSRAVYKLMTGAEFHAVDLKRREEKKEARKEQHIKPEKLLTLNSKISTHDLNSKISKTVKWIEKLHEVRVSIAGNETDGQKNDKIIEAIEEGVKPVGGRLLQKRVKDGVVKFTIMPTLKKEPKENPADKHGSPPATPEKKLLDNETPNVQVQQLNGGISTKSSRDEDEKVAKRLKVTAVIGVLLAVKYGFWSFVYEAWKR